MRASGGQGRESIWASVRNGTTGPSVSAPSGWSWGSWPHGVGPFFTGSELEKEKSSEFLRAEGSPASIP